MAALSADVPGSRTQRPANVWPVAPVEEQGIGQLPYPTVLSVCRKVQNMLSARRTRLKRSLVHQQTQELVWLQAPNQGMVPALPAR